MESKRPTWDQPGADPVADIRDAIEAMRNRGYEKPAPFVFSKGMLDWAKANGVKLPMVES